MGDIQMKSQPENKELYQLQTENSHLKDTIIELRNALEKQHIDNEEHIQNVLASSNDEIVQLKATINVLRDELELKKIKHEEKIQELEQAAHNESKQLKQMIDILRTQLEEQNAKKQ